ncbi:MAG TPA: 50S ribosomal protein L11 methyltransferase, partial [Chromatiaceae bacterium]|nr:50S ribosomal protein L11 methyltransferase [Chromatiaceae bacterium]
MPWIQAHLTIEKAQAPLVERLFEQLGALSVTMTDAEDQPMLEPSPGTTPLWRLTRITGLFPAELDTDELRNRVGSHLRQTPDHNLILEALEDRAWERTWLEHFQPMRFGQRLWIRPTGQQVAATDAVVVDLDPGLAFGTGTHPTTALCLEWLDSIDLEGKTVIDYGCGSGILSVAALKLGARRALALDHDPQALEATRENARRNEVDERLQILQENEVAGIEADVLVANILANVLMALA